MSQLKRDAEEVRKAGRYGDIMLVHLTPEEAGILKLLGGSGNINPNTGIMEFNEVDTIRETYRSVLGRYPADWEVQAWLTNPYGRSYNDIYNALIQSQEYKNRVATLFPSSTTASPQFLTQSQALAYLQDNRDVANAIPNNMTALQWAQYHWETYGKNEGRTLRDTYTPPQSYFETFPTYNNTATVTAGYQKALGRNPTTEEIQFWQQTPNLSEQTVLQSIFNKPEYQRRAAVVETYQEALNRAPDENTIQQWLATGSFTEQDVLNSIAQTPEFQGRAAVVNAYMEGLNRAPDENTIQQWLRTGNVTKEEVLNSIKQTQEYQLRVIVVNAFQTLTGAAPPEQELQNYVNKITQQGALTQDIIREIGQKDPYKYVEYQIKTSLSPNSSGGVWQSDAEFYPAFLAKSLVDQGITDLNDIERKDITSSRPVYFADTGNISGYEDFTNPVYTNKRTGKVIENFNLPTTYVGEGGTSAELLIEGGKPVIRTTGIDTSDSAIVPLVMIALNVALPGAGTALGTALGVPAAAATVVGNAIISAGFQVASGVPIEDAIKNAVVSAGVQTFVPNITGNVYVDNAVRSVATAALTGQPVEKALANSLIQTGAVQNLSDLSITGDRVIDSGIVSAATSAVQALATGADVSASAIAGLSRGLGGAAEQERVRRDSAVSGAGFIGETPVTDTTTSTADIDAQLGFQIGDRGLVQVSDTVDGGVTTDQLTATGQRLPDGIEIYENERGETFTIRDGVPTRFVNVFGTNEPTFDDLIAGGATPEEAYRISMAQGPSAELGSAQASPSTLQTLLTIQDQNASTVSSDEGATAVFGGSEAPGGALSTAQNKFPTEFAIPFGFTLISGGGEPDILQDSEGKLYSILNLEQGKISLIPYEADIVDEPAPSRVINLEKKPSTTTPEISTEPVSPTTAPLSSENPEDLLRELTDLIENSNRASTSEPEVMDAIAGESQLVGSTSSGGTPAEGVTPGGGGTPSGGGTLGGAGVIDPGGLGEGTGAGVGVSEAPEGLPEQVVVTGRRELDYPPELIDDPFFNIGAQTTPEGPLERVEVTGRRKTPEGPTETEEVTESKGTPPPVEGEEIPMPPFEEPPITDITTDINVLDPLVIRPITVPTVPVRVPPGTRLVRASQLTPTRVALSEGPGEGVYGTPEEEQQPVWNIRSLKLRKALRI